MTHHLSRQILHWQSAVSRLEQLENLATAAAWASLEQYMGAKIRGSILDSLSRLRVQGDVLLAQLQRTTTPQDLKTMWNRVQQYRNQYLQTEQTVHFFTDAINTRTNAYMSKYLRACDIACRQSLTLTLQQFNRESPAVLCYVDKSLGASILKAGLRLWDGQMISPAAVIKLTYHNLPRPTAMIHETGHQFGHELGWNEALANSLYNGLQPHDVHLANVWSSWASEIVADAYAFVHTGYAAVAALHDVLSGSEYFVYNYNENDPHPISYLRVLLNIQMCKEFFGAGPWDDLETNWRATYDSNAYASPDISIITRSLSLLPLISRIALKASYQCFGGKTLSQLVNPLQVSPSNLAILENTLGDTGLTQTSNVQRYSLQILALTGFRLATQPERFVHYAQIQEQFMLTLGNY